MSREVRRVPANWEHPKNAEGHYLALFGGSFTKYATGYDEEASQWEKGFHRSFASDKWEPKTPDMTDTFAEWSGERHKQEDYMPDWPEAECTHYQMYETTTEGTPISPVMETPEKLARWLADNNASAFGREGASYEAWLNLINSGGSSVGAMAIPGKGLVTGVEAMYGKQGQ